jgi:hypothetical protein
MNENENLIKKFEKDLKNISNQLCISLMENISPFQKLADIYVHTRGFDSHTHT